MAHEIHRLHGRAVLVGAALCMALSGCGADEQSAGGPNKPEQRAEALSSGQILFVVAAINEGELNQAQAVVDRLEDAVVRAYAQKLVADHRAAAAELATLRMTLGAKEEPSALRTEVEQHGQKANQSVEQAPADRLAPSFLDAQISMHSKAIATVDQLLAQ
jgi:predicted outer membrane protein